MNKYLFYAMSGEKMCFVHVLLNALDLQEAGHAVKIVFEGASVKLPPVLAGNPLYQKALASGIIDGVCRACAEMMGVTKEIERLGLPLIKDMNGHAGVRPYVDEGYAVISI